MIGARPTARAARCLALCSWLGCLAAVGPAWAQAPSASAVTPRPLAALPEAPRLVPRAATAVERDDLDGLLGRLTGNSPDDRAAATREIAETPPAWVPAIDAKLTLIATGTERSSLRPLWEKIGKDARKGRPKEEATDYLAALEAHAEPASKTWRDLTQVVALIRMLAAIGTTEAVRELVDVFARFGDTFRVDVQLRLAELGDRAVPALIEARRHQAEKVARWAARQLDALGKAIPSEAVQVSDHQVLADVLRAYGRTKDPDAARIVISFAASERAVVREAARQAVVMMGEVALWQLRDAYEDAVGKRAARDWTWDRVARELFGELDRQRAAEVWSLFEQGRAADAKGDVDEARRAYDRVLARNPSFERGGDMVAGYVAFAAKHADDDRAAAITALLRAERLETRAAERAPIRALRMTLEGETLLERGVADQTLLRNASDLDPGSARSRAVLARAVRGEASGKQERARLTAAAAIGAVTLVAMAAIGLRRRRTLAPAAHVPTPTRDDDRPE